MYIYIYIYTYIYIYIYNIRICMRDLQLVERHADMVVQLADPDQSLSKRVGTQCPESLKTCRHVSSLSKRVGT